MLLPDIMTRQIIIKYNRTCTSPIFQEAFIHISDFPVDKSEWGLLKIHITGGKTISHLKVTEQSNSYMWTYIWFVMTWFTGTSATTGNEMFCKVNGLSGTLLMFWVWKALFPIDKFSDAESSYKQILKSH